MKDKLTLRRPDYPSSKKQKKKEPLWLRLAHPAMIAFFFYQHGIENIWIVLKLLIIFIPLLMIVSYFHKKWAKKTKIEISDEGIKYTSGLPRFVNLIYKDWAIAWSDIEYVSFIQRQLTKHPLVGTIRIKTAISDYKISSDQWFDPEKEEPSYTFKEKFKPWKILEDRIKNNRLFEIFKEQGFTIERTDSPHKTLQLTDLNTSPIALVMAGFFIFSIIYFIVENFFTLSEHYASTPPYLWFTLCGILGGSAGYYILKKSKLQFGEIIIMSFFVGCGVVLVSYPVALRMNQWMDKDGLQSYSYKLIEKGRWMPESFNQQVPDLNFDLKNSRYWDSFEINTSKKFELRKGGLGFYQVNMDEIYVEQHKFYKAL